MRHLVFVLLFVLGGVVGACATAAVQSSASARLVVPIEAAERRVSPDGQGSVTILARGERAFVARLELAAKAGVPLHRDATEEYIHVLEGHGMITIDGASHPVAAGTTIYMPANAEVRYDNGDAPLVAIQVFAGPEPAAKYDTWTPAK